MFEVEILQQLNEEKKDLLTRQLFADTRTSACNVWRAHRCCILFSSRDENNKLKVGWTAAILKKGLISVLAPNHPIGIKCVVQMRIFTSRLVT